MIVVDTSVWVDVLRRPVSRRAGTFRSLMDADEIALALPVRVELMSGVAKAHRRELRRGLSGLPVVVPSEETWRVIEGWVEPAADAGLRFSVTDLLIAALAHELTALVWSIDTNFTGMERIGLVQLYADGVTLPRERSAARSRAKS